MLSPIPPPELVYRVAGTDNAEWFDRSGALTIANYRRGLESVGLTWSDFNHIYDFGCGCGRVLRWLPEFAPRASIAGSDIDAPAIAWVRENLPSVDARVNDGLPPLAFGDAEFDLILAYSVFTHLDEEYQDAWLSELRRVARPGAVLLLTISSDAMWEDTMQTSTHPKLNDLRALRPELDARGFVFWSADGWEAHFPDFYHTTFHSHEYVRRHWSQWFTVINIVPGVPGMAQDIVVCRLD